MFRPKETWNQCGGINSTCSLTDGNVCKKLFLDKKGVLNLSRIPKLEGPLENEFNIGRMLGGGKSGAVLFLVTPKDSPKGQQKVLKIYLDAIDEFGEILNERPYREVYTQCMVNGIDGFNCTQCFGLAPYPSGPSFNMLKEIELPVVKPSLVLYQVTSLAGGKSLMDLDLSKLQSSMLNGMCLEIYSTWQVINKRLGNFTHWDFHPDNIFIDVVNKPRNDILYNAPNSIQAFYDFMETPVFDTYYESLRFSVINMTANVALTTLEGFFTVFNKIRETASKYKPFGTRNYTYDFEKTDLEKQILIAREEGTKQAHSDHSSLWEDNIFAADKYFFTTKLKMEFPTVKLIDFDLVTSTAFPKLLPENEMKKNSYFGITERALQFCFKWLGGPGTLRWLSILLSFRTLYDVLKEVPIINRLLISINEDMYHIATYIYVMMVLRKKKETLELIEKLQKKLKVQEDTRLPTDAERLAATNEKFKNLSLKDPVMYVANYGGLLLQYYTKKIAMRCEDTILSLLFGTNFSVSNLDIEKLISEEKDTDYFTYQPDIFDDIGETILWQSIKIVSEFGLGVCLTDCLTDGVQDYLTLVANYSVGLIRKIADKFAPSGIMARISGANSTFNKFIDEKFIKAISNIVQKFRPVKKSVTINFSEGEFNIAESMFRTNCLDYYQLKKFYPHPDVMGMSIAAGTATKKIWLNAIIDEKDPAKSVDIYFSGIRMSITSKQVIPEIKIDSNFSNYAIGFSFKDNYPLGAIIADMQYSKNNYIQLTDIFTILLMKKKLNIKYPDGTKEIDERIDIQKHNSYMCLGKAVLSGGKLILSLSVSCSVDDFSSLNLFLEQYERDSLELLDNFLNNVSKTIPMFTLMSHKYKRNKFPGKLESNLHVNNIYTLTFKYMASPNPCLNALGGIISMNFDLVNFLNCSSILSDLINKYIVENLEKTIGYFLKDLHLSNLITMPTGYIKNIEDRPVGDGNSPSANGWTLLYFFYLLHNQYDLQTFFHDGDKNRKPYSNTDLISFGKEKLITTLLNFIKGGNKEKTKDISFLFNELEKKKNLILEKLLFKAGIGQQTLKFAQNYFQTDLTNRDGALSKMILPIDVFTERLKDEYDSAYMKEKRRVTSYKKTSNPFNVFNF